MFKNNRECRYITRCHFFDPTDEFCYEDGGIRTDGKPRGGVCYTWDYFYFGKSEDLNRNKINLIYDN
ncbi:hypothetical protein A3K73_05730 [Candidatus Pacearchaeota archaeon RBG_13_36_9]|nr:MAG: hypothetical protein A3K73_05730 [Candidatus Pacearchaeota archaeon RBG_13_36_9]